MSEKIKRLDENGLLYVWNKVKALIPTKTSQLNNDSGFLTSHQDISGKLDKTGDGKDVTVTFTQAASRANITTGEKLSTVLGKIAKYLADMKTVAFSGSYNDLANKPTIPTDTADLTNGAGFQNAAQVQGIVNAAVTSVFKPKGTIAFASLPTPDASNVGWVYNVSDAFTTTASFLEGADKAFPAGTNIAVVESGGKYYWDVFPGFIDLSGYIQVNDLVAITNAEIDAICV